MLHVWLIPALIVLGVVLVAFYLLLKFKGGSGVRTEGRTVTDNPVDLDEPPPS